MGRKGCKGGGEGTGGMVLMGKKCFGSDFEMRGNTDALEPQVGLSSSFDSIAFRIQVAPQSHLRHFEPNR